MLTCIQQGASNASALEASAVEATSLRQAEWQGAHAIDVHLFWDRGCAGIVPIGLRYQRDGNERDDDEAAERNG